MWIRTHDRPFVKEVLFPAELIRHIFDRSYILYENTIKKQGDNLIKYFTLLNIIWI